MKPIADLAREFAQTLGLDDTAIARRKSFLEFTETDAARLKRLRRCLPESFPRTFAEAFYDHLLNFEETRRLITDPSTLERLQRTQSHYFDTLFSGDYGRDYIHHRLCIGIAHHRVGLAPHWYLGAYVKYLAGLLPVMQRIFKEDPAALVAPLSSLIKIIFLDIGLAIDTYTEADRRTISALQAYAEMTFASLPFGLLVLSPQLRILSANRQFFRQFHLTDEAVRGRSLSQVVVAEGLEALTREVLTTGDTRQGLRLEMGVRDRTERLPVRLTLAGIRLAEEEEEEEEARLLVVIEDISEQVNQERALEAEYELNRRLLETLPVGVVACDSEGRLAWFNEVAKQWYEGIEVHPLPPERWAEHYHLYETDGVTPLATEHNPLFRALQGETVRDAEITIIPPGRPPRFVSCNATPLRTPDGRFLGAVVVILDISDRKAAEARITQLAFYDPLTGLPNRTLGLDRLRQGIANAHRHRHTLAVLFVDLDRFKHVNDSLGHGAGDRLLQEAARRLRTCVRESDTIARLGGDEFIVVLDEVTEETAAMVAHKLLQALRRPFPLAGHTLRLSGSIGIALYPRDGDTPQALLRSADAAMYRAKEQGRDTVRFYTEELGHKARKRLALEADLHRALERKQFSLDYQPRFAIAGERMTMIGMEALVRWHHPQRGTIPPGDFIPLAEETGFILTLGEWVLYEACRQAVAWRNLGLNSGRVAVNLSIRQFHQPDLAGKIAAILEATGLPPCCLELEITESMVAKRVEEAVTILDRLNGLGIHLALDDFGTGYSNLSQLKRFPVQVLKIDRSFVADLPKDTSIVTAILSMGHAMGMRVVAEGVETAEQLAFLQQSGCDEAQGFLLSKPLPATRLEALLRQKSLQR